MDLFEKCRLFTEAREAIADGTYPFFTTLDEHEGTIATHQGRKVIMCGSNNYLGLTTDPRVRQAAKDALEHYGPSCTGSRFLNGNLRMHEQLEEELAAFFGKQAALVFSTGYQANLGAVAALVGRNDVAVIDKDDHACIVDGCRLSFGEMKRFAHNDMADLERQLRGLPARAGRLVIVDGVFSMGGDLAPLPEIVRLCKQYEARLLVDDAHGAGVLASGRGTSAHFGLADQVDLIMITFSKSFASLGGAIIGDEDVIHYIKHHARSLIYSASIPPSNAAAALAALRIMRDEPQHAQRVMAIGAQMRRALSSLGYQTGPSQTPIVPIIIGDREPTFALWRMLLDAGVFTNPVIPPAAPIGRLRTSYMATHTEEQLNQVVELFAWAGRRLGIIPQEPPAEPAPLKLAFGF
ncbi:MAG TPA: pyridoxal phosphate-dependent aminotransferase family protein [Roseiflexaceae bacterium]|nr:pyridoxal phosphate-dependent aminotransferase family protein [Roseiflexaceae bacterium]